MEIDYLMELVFLGTGAGLPSVERNVTACVLNLARERHTLWLFDCGEGTQHQFLRTNLKLNKIEKIFITHLHGDHIFGLPGLLGTRSFKGGVDPLTIYGLKGIKAYLDTVLAISNTYLPYSIEVFEISEGVIFEDHQFIVSTAPLKHRIASYGFRVVEKDRTGSLRADLLKAEGVPEGPIYGLLKEGKQITLADGRLINGSDYLTPPEHGKVVAIFGDTEPTDSQIILAKDADVVVHEATVEGALEALASERGHSTTRQTATMAKEAGAKRLIITHISSRYGQGDIERLLTECREVFEHTKMATDLAVFEV